MSSAMDDDDPQYVQINNGTAGGSPVVPPAPTGHHHLRYGQQISASNQPLVHTATDSIGSIGHAGDESLYEDDGSLKPQHPNQSNAAAAASSHGLTSAPASSSGPGGFTVFGKYIPWSAALALFCVGTVVGGTGQQVTLSLFEASFGPGAGIYFTLFFCAMSFNLFFWPIAFFLIYKGGIPPEQTAWNTKHQLYMAAVGFCDAANGFLVVFSSSLARVPGPMQSILLQAMIPATLVSSRLLLRKMYSRQQMAGAGMVLVGIFFSLIPLFIRLHKGTESAAVPSGQWYWPLILLLSVVPGALMNVIQEKLQHLYLLEAPLSGDRRFSVIWFQACESFYQFVFIGGMFWLDLVPGFGTSTNLSVFKTGFDFGFDCFVNTSAANALSSKCGLSGVLGTVFIGSYILSYIFGTLMTLYASANLASIMQAVPPVLGTIFWYAFPSINSWGGGTPFTGLDAGFNLGSIPFIAFGIWLYRTHELGKEEKAPQPDEGDIELCF